MTRKVMLSAIQPTNRITLGNYLGAIKQWVPNQDVYEGIYFLVNLHAITLRQDPKELKEQTYKALAVYIASGLSPTKSLLFVQSQVKEHAELAWVLNCFSYMGEVSRMTQYKDKSSKQGQNIPVGLFTYPLLMAADILLYGTNYVPVGEDQKQHVELTRDIAMRMNNIYGDDLFVIPEPMIPKVGARIMSLQNPEAKMSKSDPDANSAIYLFDTDDEIRKKVKRAVTDSGSEIVYSDDKPGLRNLLNIQAAILGKSPADIAQSYVGKQYGHLKVDTAEIVVQEIAPIRQEALRLFNEKQELDKILQTNAERASQKAQVVLKKVYDRVGFL